MKIPIITRRLEEIKVLVEGNDISGGTRRLVDFCIDFPLSEKLETASVELRAKFNRLDKTIKAEDGFDMSLSLRLEILVLVDRMEVECEKMGEGSMEDESAFFAELASPAERLKERKNAVYFAEEIYKSYGNSTTGFTLSVHNIDLHPGQITGVVGENGNGKTTLLRIICGDLMIDKGNPTYPKLQEDRVLDWFEVKKQIAYIPQRVPRWFGRLKENLQFAASIHGIRGKENETQTNLILHRLGLTQYENATWSQISSGYKLRFELARALVWRPKLLILDEPLANLDINTRALFLQDLRYLANSLRYPISIIISSQQLHEVEDVSDNVIFLENGRSLYNGSMKEFGEDRQENIFEITTHTPQEILISKFSASEHINIEFFGTTAVFRTELDFPGQLLLKELVEKEVDVQYFREISKSTRKLFRKAHA